MNAINVAKAFSYAKGAGVGVGAEVGAGDTEPAGKPTESKLVYKVGLSPATIVLAAFYGPAEPQTTIPPSLNIQKPIYLLLLLGIQVEAMYRLIETAFNPTGGINQLPRRQKAVHLRVKRYQRLKL